MRKLGNNKIKSFLKQVSPKNARKKERGDREGDEEEDRERGKLEAHYRSH